VGTQVKGGSIPGARLDDNARVTFSFFTADTSARTEVLTPTDAARSLWSADQMHGVAVSGAMSRAIELAMPRHDLRPARYTLDMFRPATMSPFTAATTIVREGRRICLVDAVLVQDGEPRARASAIFLAPSEDPDGEVWQPTDNPTVPVDVPVLTEPDIPWFASDKPWSQDFVEHQNAGRKQTWQHGVPIVAGEEPTPFQAVASIADATTLACNWGSKGVQYINTDITLSLSRLPRTAELGLRGERWSGHDGIAVGVATVFDRDGVIGQSMVTSLSNALRTVDFQNHEFNEDGSRTSRV
jgi:hypothetical protein